MCHRCHILILLKPFHEPLQDCPIIPSDSHCLLRHILEPAVIRAHPERRQSRPYAAKGRRSVCFDDLSSDLTAQQQPCNVLSVGIDNDFSFDEAMAASGCHVHSFDPSMGKSDHMHSEGVYFHNIGLGFVDSDMVIGKAMKTGASQKWKVRKLTSLMELVGFKYASILKVDIEGGEWEVLEKLLAGPPEHAPLRLVDQILVELHLWPTGSQKTNVKRWLRVFARLHIHGFHVFALHTNPLSSATNWGAGARPCCYEISFIKPKRATASVGLGAASGSGMPPFDASGAPPLDRLL